MCESRPTNAIRRSVQNIPYDSDESLDEVEITMALMELSEQSLEEFLEGEPDIYTVDDLKVRYR